MKSNKIIFEHFMMNRKYYYKHLMKICSIYVKIVISNTRKQNKFRQKLGYHKKSIIFSITHDGYRKKLQIQYLYRFESKMTEKRGLHMCLT